MDNTLPTFLKRRLPSLTQSGLALSMLLLALHGEAKVGAGDDFLLPEQAFKLSAGMPDGRSLELRFDIAEGYYLYREQLRFDATPAVLGDAALPVGEVKFDETFQKKVETYRGQLRVVLPVQTAVGMFRVAVRYQGCADKGLCYAPLEWRAEVDMPGAGRTPTLRVLVGNEAIQPMTPHLESAVEAAPVGWSARWSAWGPWLAGAAVVAAVAALWAFIALRVKA